MIVITTGIKSNQRSTNEMYGYGPSNEQLFSYLIFDALSAGFNRFVFIVRKSALKELKQEVQNKLQNNVKSHFVIDTYFSQPQQANPKPRGSANQLLLCKGFVKEPFFVIHSDSFYGRNTFKAALQFLRKNKHNIAAFTNNLYNTLPYYGKVNRGICLKNNKNQLLSKVWEIHDIFKEARGNYKFHGPKEYVGVLEDSLNVTIGAFCLQPKIIEIIDAMVVSAKNPNKQYSITEILKEIVQFTDIPVETIEMKSKFFDARFKSGQIMLTHKIEALVENGEYPLVLFKKRSHSLLGHSLKRLFHYLGRKSQVFSLD
ncbi:MAG: hypothetical protein AAF378_00505 [Cyanobacteria bacterium P01_A01_bin.84]